MAPWASTIPNCHEPGRTEKQLPLESCSLGRRADSDGQAVLRVHSRPPRNPRLTLFTRTAVALPPFLPTAVALTLSLTTRPQILLQVLHLLHPDERRRDAR
jgi:hypothetical protein